VERVWSIAVDAPWRAYPAAALALLGLASVVRGLWFGAAGSPGLLRQGRDAFAWIRCFQFAVGGLALLGLAAAWVWRQPWLLVVSLAILGEELLETSRILTALRRSPRRPPATEQVEA
jgi:cytochrome c biogenesis protein CcdA